MPRIRTILGLLLTSALAMPACSESEDGLVHHIAKGRKPEPRPEAPPEPTAASNPTQPATNTPPSPIPQLQGAPPAAPTPDTTDPPTATPQPEPAHDQPTLSDLPTRTLSPAEQPFVGRWLNETSSGSAILRLEITLTDDGLFLAQGRVLGPSTASVSTSGIWEFSGDALMLTRLRTSHPDKLPVGVPEVFWRTRLIDGHWHCEDIEGLPRIFTPLP